MSIKAGLLKARGQIAFIAALAISTGVIIYLETLDTETRIRSRVEVEVQRRETVPASLRSAVRASLRQSEEAFAGDPAAASNRAALLTSLAAAAQVGTLDAAEAQRRVETVLAEIDRNRGEESLALTSAMNVAAAIFPPIRERVAALSPRL